MVWDVFTLCLGLLGVQAHHGSGTPESSFYYFCWQGPEYWYLRGPLTSFIANITLMASSSDTSSVTASCGAVLAKSSTLNRQLKSFPYENRRTSRGRNVKQRDIGTQLPGDLDSGHRLKAWEPQDRQRPFATIIHHLIILKLLYHWWISEDSDVSWKLAGSLFQHARDQIQASGHYGDSTWNRAKRD